MEDQISDLLSQGLFRSAELLCGAFARKEPRKRSSRQLELYASALQGQDKWSRALKYYELALENSKTKARSSHLDTVTDKEAAVMEKMAKCHLSLKQENQAAQVLARIPFKSRSTKVHMVMGVCFEKLQKKKSAMESYQAALQQNSLVVEAACALLRLGVDPRRVMGLYTGNKSWIAKLMEANGQYHALKHKQSIKAWRELCEEYPYNADYFAEKGQVELQSYDDEVARKSFERARALDSHITEGMDMLALVLRKRGRTDELNELVYTLLRNNKGDAGTWVAVALYNDQTGQKEKALEFVERALVADPSHVGAHIIKSRILFSISDTDGAVQTYRKAYQLQKGNLCVFQGLVEAYLAGSEFKQALLTAKEALQLMPRNSKALTLVGLVLSHSPEGQEKATKAFNKALILDPSCVDAVMAAAKMHCHNKNFPEALRLMRAYLEKQSTDEAGDYMHTKLAHIYALSGDLEQALMHFHKALSLTPNYPQAISGIERVEQNLKGGFEDSTSMVDDDIKDDSFEDY